MAKLVVIDGPARGSVYALDAPEVYVGRSSTNAVAIPDPSLSRRHCSLHYDGKSYLLRDLGSNNGTLVNDTPVVEHTLIHGDRIAAGDSVLVFLIGEDDAVHPRVDSSISAGQTIHLTREEAFYVNPERFTESAAPTARLVRDLHSLLRIGNTLAVLKSVEALARQLLELVLEAVPAERGAILFVDESSEQVSTVYGHDRRSGAGPHVPISSTVVDRVLKEGTAISSNDARYTGVLEAAESLRVAGVKSVLAAPILRGDRVMGVIYLDSSDPGVSFDRGHLQLLTAISGVAALALENVRRLEGLAEENRRLQAEVDVEHSMVGDSPALRETIRLISRVAPSEATVLVFGESGTGKELAARAIHQNSPRSSRPFLAINCAVLTETLLESELFGHEKGAFTGAYAQKKGRLELADGGTVFLDEIGELAPSLQAKLLRVLQEREFERVGGTRPIKVDVRIVAATNRDLAVAVKDKLFRQDLYYRLNVVSITMPPLRDRREDILLLANYFIQKFSRRTSARRVRGVSAKARALLELYAWPGNVRELENVIERAVVLGTADMIAPEDLPETLLEVGAGTIQLDEYHSAVNESRRQIILRALEKSKGNVARAARQLDIQPTYLHRLIRNLNLRPGSKENGADEESAEYPKG